MNKHYQWIKTISIILLFLIILIMYSYNLNRPSEPYFDEANYLEFINKLRYEHVIAPVAPHPPLWSLLTLGCITLFGENIISLRLVSFISGLLLIFIVYLLGLKILKNKIAALLAVFFFSFDCISLTQARIGMLGALALLFMMLAFLIFLPIILDKEKPKKTTFLTTGIFLGLALSTKLSSLSMVVIIYFLVFICMLKNKNERRELFLNSVIFLGFVPAIIYVATHIFIAFLPGYSWRDIIKIEVLNFRYHTSFAKTQSHPYYSSWWQWPLLLRPIWFYSVEKANIINGIVCIGNPVIFWMIPVIIFYLIKDFLYSQSKTVGLIILGFFGQWLLYASVNRPQFLYYFYFSMPFLAMGVAWFCKTIWDKSTLGKLSVVFYLLLTLAMFIYWYPLLIGLPISEKYFWQHIWLKWWV